MITTIQTVTPRIASEWLKNNPSNRIVSNQRVQKYAADMKNGRWLLTHQGIALGDDDIVVDGQHRLLAVCVSGVPIVSLVTRGVSADVFKSIDIGAARRPADVVSIAGIKGRLAKIVSAAISYSVCYEAEMAPRNSIPTKFGNTNELTLNYLSENKAIITSGKFIETMPRRDAVIKESISCFLHHQISKIRDNADEFIGKLLTGEGLYKEDVIYEMRSMLLANKFKNFTLSESVVIDRIIATYNYYSSGVKRKDWYQAIRRTPVDGNPRRLK